MKHFGALLWDLFEKIVRAVIGFFLKLVRVRLTEEQWKKFMQFVKFCVVGVSNAIASYVVYLIVLYGALSVFEWNPELEIQISGVCGFFASITNSYYWNSKYVFGSGQKRSFLMHLKAYFKVCLSYSISGLLIGNLLLWLWTSKLGISPAIAPLLNQIVTLPINFIMNKFWAFKEKPIKHE